MNNAEYVDNTPDDLLVVNSARVSFDKQSIWEDHDGNMGVLKAGDRKLIQYLARNNHWTPFSHARVTFYIPDFLALEKLTPELSAGLVFDEPQRLVRHSIWGWAQLMMAQLMTRTDEDRVAAAICKMFPVSAAAMGMEDTSATPAAMIRPGIGGPSFHDVTMRETVPIFVARQRFKHMVGFTYNEVSRRYVDDTPEFFYPEAWRMRPDASIKQGSGGVHTENDDLQPMYREYVEVLADLYERFVEDGIAPEQARMLLPQSMLTSYYVTGSLTAWARAYKQRSDSHAQIEIQDLAADWNAILTEEAPDTWPRLIT